MRLYDTGSGTQLGYSGSHGSTEDEWYDVRAVVDGSDVEIWRGEDGGIMEKVFDVSTASTTTTGHIEFRGQDGYMHLDDIRIAADGLSDSYTYTYNTANELTAMSGPNGSTSYGYDEYGRMTSKDRGTKSATYDYRYGHKLHDVTTDFPGEGDVTYTTGGDGKRRTRTVNSVETWYRWDAGYTVLNEEDDSGNLTQGYVDRNMGHYTASGSLYEYYFTDHLGSTRALYDGTDDLTATYDYTPYGEHYATQNAAATTHQYTGHDWDPAANLYFAPYRYYGPEMARWMKRDPLGEIDGTNTYAYVSNHPVRTADFLGLFGGPIPGPGGDLPDYFPDAPPPGCDWPTLRKLYKDMVSRTSVHTDKLRHCTISCVIAKRCGKRKARFLGNVKEFRDWLLGNGDKQEREDDQVANQIGRCYSDVVAAESDCETACTNNYPRPSHLDPGLR